MSEEKIVNRITPVASVDGQTVKLQELHKYVDGEEDFQQGQVVPEPEPTPAAVIDTVLEKAKDDLMPATAPDVPAQEHGPTLEELINKFESSFTTVPVGVSEAKFNEFRDQVIAAFKHIGLDTRKHFKL